MTAARKRVGFIALALSVAAPGDVATLQIRSVGGLLTDSRIGVVDLGALHAAIVGGLVLRGYSPLPRASFAAPSRSFAERSCGRDAGPSSLLLCSTSYKPSSYGRDSGLGSRPPCWPDPGPAFSERRLRRHHRRCCGSCHRGARLSPRDH